MENNIIAKAYFQYVLMDDLQTFRMDAIKNIEITKWM
jgi:hypothetical protein